MREELDGSLAGATLSIEREMLDRLHSSVFRARGMK
jgi:hypothetical protein